MTRTRTTLPLALLAVAILACAGPGQSRQRKGAEIHHDLAVEALRRGNAQEALREYDEALKLDDRLPEAYRGRGLVYEFGFGRLEDAERDFRKALVLRPDFAEAHNDLGQLLAKTGRLDKAVAEFDLALGDVMYREPWVARCNKGLALYRMGKKDDGRAELKGCVAAAPRYCLGRRELGLILLQENRPKDALEQFNVYADQCKVPDAYLRVAQTRMKLGDVSGARDAFERCTALGQATPEVEECNRGLELLK